MRWWLWRGLRAGGAGGWDERADARLGQWRRSRAVERGLYVCTQLLTLTDPVVPPCSNSYKSEFATPVGKLKIQFKGPLGIKVLKQDDLFDR